MKKLLHTITVWSYGNAKYMDKKKLSDKDILFLRAKSQLVGVFFIITLIIVYLPLLAFFIKYMGMKWSKNIFTISLAVICLFASNYFVNRAVLNISIEELEAAIIDTDIKKIRQKWLILLFSCFLLFTICVAVAIKR
jgi:hypothetical protein